MLRHLIGITLNYVSILAEDHVQNTEKKMLIRERREESERIQEIKDHIQTCCNVTVTHTKTEEEETDERVIKEHCSKFVYDKLQNITTDRMKNRATCVFQCAFEQMKLADSDGNLIEDESTLGTLGLLLSVKDEKLLKKVSTHCGKISKENAQKETEKFVCSRRPILYTLCAYDVMNWFCKEEAIIRSKQCDALRQNLKAVFLE
ncbi:hypothetical protein C0J52_10248 [Blattella germanica]|nr:hypothetical protein C0J52_10248 [Blattella germanica]